VVSNTVALTSALANTAVGRIVLAPGTYILNTELSITRSVVLEAAVAGLVALDAQASSVSQRRVLSINPGSLGVVQLIGLNITGGYNVRGCCRDLLTPHRPHGKMADMLALTHACTSSNALVNYRMYVPQRSCKLPIAPMGRWLTCPN
jgi:hypothetical protein